MNRENRVWLCALVGLAALLTLAAQPAWAQSELVLSLSRDFGYGGLDNSIEGLFSISAAGPEDLERVDFYLDDTLMASIDQAPFRFQFSTSSYAPGAHSLYALGYTRSGAELRSNEITRTFLTKEQSQGVIWGILVPLFGAVLLIMVLSAVIPSLLGRKATFKGSYGMLGGTVCPKCGLPFSYSFLAPNMLVGKLQRCPHCGRWSLVRRARPQELAAAEARWRGDAEKPMQPEDKAERARRQIDDSRYEE